MTSLRCEYSVKLDQDWRRLAPDSSRRELVDTAASERNSWGRGRRRRGRKKRKKRRRERRRRRQFLLGNGDQMFTHGVKNNVFNVFILTHKVCINNISY